MLLSKKSRSKRMYSPSSPTFSSLDRSAIAASTAAIHDLHHHHHLHNHNSSSSSTGSTATHNFPQFSGASLADTCDGLGLNSGPSQCVKFKYFTTFIVCTTCLALLSASLATHKWIISRPIKVLRSKNGPANLTSLMLSLNQQDNSQQQTNHDRYRYPSALLLTNLNNVGQEPATTSSSSTKLVTDTKFQGEIYFGLFRGVKVLNHGFGDRYTPISVWQTLFSSGGTTAPTTTGPQQQATGTQQQQQQQELISFKFWLLTLVSVSLAALFALIGSIFAIINFVITPRGTLSGPVGLVIWNAAACFACLLATISWLVEYFVRLQGNVLSLEEVQSGWSSENRTQFGYSYYFVVAAFVLHLVNIFIVSIVQFETWNQHKAAKRQSRALCEGVIMLY